MNIDNNENNKNSPNNDNESIVEKSITQFLALVYNQKKDNNKNKAMESSQEETFYHTHGYEYMNNVIIEHTTNSDFVVDAYITSLVDALKESVDCMDISSSTSSLVVDIKQNMNPKSMLYLLCGILDRCNTTTTESERSITFSFSTYKSLGNFMLHESSTILSNDHNKKEEYLKIISALFKCTNIQTENPLECILYRLNISKQCVSYAMDYDSTKEEEEGNKMYTFIRSQRSACFDILLQSIQGHSHDNNTATTTVTNEEEKEIISFVIFCSNCIQGESDPRCLLQSLQLLQSCQEHLYPLLTTTTSQELFPCQTIYDTVSCYYPIDFTPPPNDTFGITKEQLQTSLRAVLCWDYGLDVHVKGLMVRLFLDRLLECCEEEELVDGMIEEPIQDLALVLKAHTLEQIQYETDAPLLKEISDSLFKIHSKLISTSTSTNNKQVMKQIRDLSSAIISKLRIESKQIYLDAIWEVLDNDSSSTSISSSPTYVIDVAFVSAISIVDYDTFMICINHILPPLVILDVQQDSDDYYDVQVKRLEVFSLFLNATWSLLNRNDKDDDSNISSHPMEQYSCIIWNILSSSLKELLAPTASQPLSDLSSSESCTSKNTNKNKYVKVVLQTLQSFIASLLPSSHSQDKVLPPTIKTDLIQTISNLIQHLVLIQTTTEEEELATHEDWCKHHGANTIGMILSSSIQETDSFLYPHVLDWITLLLDNSTHSSTKSYISIRILAQSCQLSTTICEKVVFYYTNIITSNHGNNEEQLIVVANHLAFILLFNSNNNIDTLEFNVQQSIWNYIVEKFTKDILSSLLSSFTAKVDVHMMDDSQLLLPATYQQVKRKADCQLQYCLSILQPLVPIYQTISNQDTNQILQISLFSNLEKCIPPLSYMDSISNKLILMILAPVLSISATLDVTTTSTNNNRKNINGMDVLLLLIPSFIDHALSNTEENATRLAAASCLHSICIFIHTHKKDYCVNVNDFMNDILLDQYLFSILEKITNTTDDDFLEKLEDILNLIGLVGSATQYHTGSTSIDRIVKLFVRIACSPMLTQPSATDHNDDYIGTPSTINYKFLPTKASILAAKAFESMLSSSISTTTHNATVKPSPFWKQRACYTALPLLLQHTSKDDSSCPSSIAIDLILAHFGCGIPVLALGEENVTIILNRITYRLGNAHEATDYYGMDEFATVALAALVKFLALSSSNLMSNHVPEIIQSILQFLTYSYSKISIPQILLSLQCLMNVTYVMNSNIQPFQLLVNHCLKKILDHPCRIVRTTSVSVTNHWCLLGK